MGPRLIKALVLGCRDGAGEAGIIAALGSTPQYSRLKYMPLRLVEWRIQNMATQELLYSFRQSNTH
jgi:hypothetical protein